jgi:nucleoside-diphosphate-sugar epimerase
MYGVLQPELRGGNGSFQGQRAETGMNTANEVIVALVTASHQVDHLDASDVADLMRLAITLAQRLQSENSGDAGRSGNDLAALVARAENLKDMSQEQWQSLLREAAERLRDLEPGVDPETALPTYLPAAGDGGNY